MMTAKELTNEITNFVNTFTPEGDEFTASMSTEHRTLQQSFTRLCLMWLEHCASEEYRFDDRNAASHRVSEQLIAMFKEVHGNIAPSMYLPTI